MELDDKNAPRVGAVVLLLIIVGVVLLMAVDGISLAGTVRFQIHLSHLAGLSESADVQIAGRVVGKVAATRLVPLESIPDSHPLASTGGVTLDIDIDKEYSAWAPLNGEYFVSSKGLLGEKYLEVGPPAGGFEALRGIQPGDQIRGIDPPQMDRTLERTLTNLTISRVFLETVGPEARAAVNAFDELQRTLADIEPVDGAFDSLFAHGKDVSHQASVMRDKFATVDTTMLGRTIGRIGRNQQALARSIGLFSDALVPLEAELVRVRATLPSGLADKLELVSTDLQSTLARARLVVDSSSELMASVARGEGTIGALVNDPEFSDDAKKLGKILKRKPWELMEHPGTRAQKYRRVPNPDRR